MFDDQVRSEYVTAEVIDRDGNRPPGKRLLAEHEVLDHRLCMYAQQRAALDAAEAYDLSRAQAARIHVYLGFATFLEYLERRCGYDPHTACERIRVARALEGLPSLANALSKGELSYTHVRELTRVVVPATEQAWIAAARDMTSGDTQKAVRCREKGDLPSDPEKPQLRPKSVCFEVTPEVFALVREARRVLAEERGSDITESELVEEMCRRILQPGTGESGAAHQIGYQQCPSCRQAKVHGAGRELDVTPEQFERAACDATDLGNLDADTPDRARTRVTPRFRAQVFARDGSRCVVPGCRSARCLEIHHIIPENEGGPTALWNLCLLCSGHHTARHDGRLMVTGRAPRDLRFRWTYGDPLPPNLTAFERLVEIHRRGMEAFDGRPTTTSEARGELESHPTFGRGRRRRERQRANARMSPVWRRLGFRPPDEVDTWAELEQGDVPDGTPKDR